MFNLDAKFFIAGFVEREVALKTLIEIIENDRKSENPLFHENFTIGSYGCFPGCIWNGGRVIFGEINGIGKVKEIFDWYENHNIALQLVFTNNRLEPHDIYDRYGNAILDEAMRHTNVEFKICSPYLEEHILNKYPNAKLIKSLKPIKSVSDDIIDDDYFKYTGIVLPLRYTYEMDKIKNIVNRAEANGVYVEMLINHCCIKDCPQQLAHHSDDEDIQLFKKINDSEKAKWDCAGIERQKDHYYYALTNDKLNDYIDIGLTNFKIRERAEGSYRGIDTYISGICYYLLKPEYVSPEIVNTIIQIIEERVANIRPVFKTNEEFAYNIFKECWVN